MSDINTSPASQQERSVREGGRLPRVRQLRRPAARGAPRSGRGPGEVVVDVTAVGAQPSRRRRARGCLPLPGRAPARARRGARGADRGARRRRRGLEGRRPRGAVPDRRLRRAARYCRSGRESLCTAPAWFISMGSGGAYAEKVLCKETQLVRIPDGVTDVEAAASHIAFGTAWHMLVTRARLRPGETVLVNSVGSGIGSAAVQVAKLRRRVRDRQLEPRRQARQGEGARARRRDQLHDARTWPRW